MLSNRRYLANKGEPLAFRANELFLENINSHLVNFLYMGNLTRLDIMENATWYLRILCLPNYPIDFLCKLVDDDLVVWLLDLAMYLMVLS